MSAGDQPSCVRCDREAVEPGSGLGRAYRPAPRRSAGRFFVFGGSKATVEAVLACCGVPFRSVTPAVWKRAAGIPAGTGMNDLARSRAIEQWPNRAELFARKLDHDRAEACSIGWAGLQREAAGR